MIQFYAPDIERDFLLPEIESGHCVRVLRKKEGDEIFVTNGKGKRFRCRIVKAHSSHTAVEILSTEIFDRNELLDLTLAVAPTKNADRMEWLAEKAVELGVEKIVLLRCKHSERKILKPDRLIKIMISAMKQSLGTWLPQLVEVTDIKDYVKDERSPQKFFGYCSDAFPRKDFSKEYSPGNSVAIMIGPEGDFDEEEVKMVVGSGFVPVTFGKRRLRTETAALYAVCAVSALNQKI